MMDDIVLKIKEREVFQVLKIIAIVYLVFLFFLALILKYQESVVQALIIGVFAIIVDALNSGEMVVTEKGITTKVTGFIKYSKISELELKNKVLYISLKESSKPYRITFALTEDQKLIENTFKYMDSKVKKIEEENSEHQEYVEKYL